ncbi:MAG TPA: hypothetical protein VHO27_01495 [Angustibacter sp.]|nr:hypothetical protein [Angustibacter sp.]
MNAAEPGFCPLCDVTLELHDGPDSCDSAGKKAEMLSTFFGPRP